MLNFLPAPLIAVVAFTLLMLNICFWVPILLVFALLRLLLPFQAVRLAIDPITLWIAENWISGNKAWMDLTQKIEWDVQGVEGLEQRSWYLVNSNHQSWVDIFVLQYQFNRRIPLLKFFLKQELIWVPIMGLAWWALDFPFMRRHREAYLQKHPQMRQQDQETTRKACAKFALIPTSVMNFLEGTRFTPAKHARQQSPYRYLLKPKAGGIALALDALGAKFHSLLDVTIVYPDGIPTFADLLCGRVRRVVVRVRTVEVPGPLLQGSYGEDPAFRKAFADWVAQLWRDKDALIASLLEAQGGSHPRR
ncbi:MAG: acyltransferase [Rhodoferax sp.]